MTETPRAGMKWKILREPNCKPIFEQVISSRSSGKNEKARGADLPPPQVLKGPKSARFYWVNLVLHVYFLQGIVFSPPFMSLV